MRAAEDTDFSWRLQRAGWVLAGRPDAAVEHRYRDVAAVTCGDSGAAMRPAAPGWAAAIDGFEPRPAPLRAACRPCDRAAEAQVALPTPGRARARRDRGVRSRYPGRVRSCYPESRPRLASGPATRASFAALDAILGVEELIGFALSEPPGATADRSRSTERVLVADRFRGEQTDARLGPRGTSGRIEAGRRVRSGRRAAPGVTIVYREDDGPL